MSSAKKFFSGNSLEQAVLQAARYFDLEPEELGYRRVERRHGFLKVRRRVVIEVDVDAPRRRLDEARAPVEVGPVDEPEQTPAVSVDVGSVARDDGGDSGAETAAKDLTILPEAPSSPDERYQRATGEVAEAAQESIRRLRALGNLSVEADVFRNEDGLQIEIRGDDEDVFLEDRGRLLLSMQHLLPRMIRGLTGETAACRVDCDNFQEIRAEQLRVLAQRVAAEVRDRGRPRALEPMSPDERRIVHLTLADDPKVETESQGNGLFKRVLVRPTKGRRSRNASSYR